MKIVGVVLVVLSSYLIAQYYVLVLKKKIKTSEKFIRFLSLLETRISYDCSSFLHIFGDIKTKENGVISEFLNVCLDEINSGNDIKNAWNKGVSQIERQGYLSKQDKDALVDFANNLGESNAEGQKNSISLCIDILTSNLKEAKRDFEEKNKTTISGFVLGGLFLAILLI